MGIEMEHRLFQFLIFTLFIGPPITYSTSDRPDNALIRKSISTLIRLMDWNQYSMNYFFVRGQFSFLEVFGHFLTFDGSESGIKISFDHCSKSRYQDFLKCFPNDRSDNWLDINCLDKSIFIQIPGFCWVRITLVISEISHFCTIFSNILIMSSVLKTTVIRKTRYCCMKCGKPNIDIYDHFLFRAN